MKKVILTLSILIVSGLSANQKDLNIVEISEGVLFKSNKFMTPKGEYTDYCDGKYVWRLLDRGNIGGVSQVFENKTITLNGVEIKISQVKECKLD